MVKAVSLTHAWEDTHSSPSSVTSPMVLAPGKRNFGKSTFLMSLILFSKQVLLSLLPVLGLLIYSRCLGWLTVVVLYYWGTGPHDVLVACPLPLYGCSTLHVRRVASEKSYSTSCRERFSLEAEKEEMNQRT